MAAFACVAATIYIAWPVAAALVMMVRLATQLAEIVGDDDAANDAARLVVIEYSRVASSRVLNRRSRFVSARDKRPGWVNRYVWWLLWPMWLDVPWVALARGAEHVRTGRMRRLLPRPTPRREQERSTDEPRK